MAAYIPLSIDQAGGIVAYLNLPDKVAHYGGFTGDYLDTIMRDTISDTTKRRTIRDKAGVTYSTARGWMARWYSDNKRKGAR